MEWLYEWHATFKDIFRHFKPFCLLNWHTKIKNYILITREITLDSKTRLWVKIILG